MRDPVGISHLRMSCAVFARTAKRLLVRVSRRLRGTHALLLIIALILGSIGGYELFFGRGVERAEAAYTGKVLRTVEFVLGAGAGTAATQTGTDNNGTARASDANVYAGSAWNATKGTAGTKTIEIPGSGIRVLSAYLGVTSSLLTTANVTDVELALDVSPGPQPGVDVAVGGIARNTTGLIYYSQSGASGLMSAKADVTSLFQDQTDGEWNTGLSVVGLLSITGPTWYLSTMKLTITYEQDHSLAAHEEVKTVRFPLRSTQAGDSGTRRNDCGIGATCSFTYTPDIPDLAADADVLDVWFEFTYQEAAVANVTPSINGGAAGTDHNAVGEALTDRSQRSIIYRPSVGAPNFAPNTPQTLDITIGTAAISGLGGELVITYKYMTDEPIQTETIQYWMGQQDTAPGTASSSFTRLATVINGGRDIRNAWYRVHDSVTNASTVHVAGVIGASATTTVTYTITSSNARTGETLIIHDMGSATTSWTTASTTLGIDVRHQANTYDGNPGVEAFVTFYWAGDQGGDVTKTGKFFAGASGSVPASANSDNTFPFSVTLPETVTKTLRSSYIAVAVTHSDATSIIPGTVRLHFPGGASMLITEPTEDVESFRTTYLLPATSSALTLESAIDWTTRAFRTIVRGNQSEEYQADAEMVITYDADLSEDDPPVRGEGKQVRTAEFILGAGAGSAATQTGTDNNGAARISDDNVYAGSAWNGTKSTAGTKTIRLEGTGIRVLSAYLDVTAALQNAADVTDLELALDVSPGPAPGTDVFIDEVGRNAATAIYADNSGVSSPLFSAKADATALFQTQTDGEWASGIAVAGLMSIVGPSWYLATMKLVITYEEDFSLVPHDATKTVRFPLRSTQAGDSGTRRSDCGAGTTCSFTYTLDLPDLATTSDIVDAWFEISLVENSVANVTPSINGGSAGTVHNALEALNDGMERTLIYRPMIGAPNFATTTQTLDIAIANNAVGALGGEVVVTYAYSTGAATQVETVQYWIGQATALPGTASTSFAQLATIANGGLDPRNIWFRVHDSVTTVNPNDVAVGATIGASATNTITYTATLSLARGGEYRLIHDMGSATTSWTGSSTSLAIDVRHRLATYDGPPAVEAFITFYWTGHLNGPVTKTAKYFAGSSGAVPALANTDNVLPFLVQFPESVDKTLRSSYLSTSVMHTDATTVIPGTVQISLTGRAPTTISEGTEDAENFRAFYLTIATSTDFLIDGLIGWNTRAFQTMVRGNQPEEYAVNSELVVTYDADLELKVPVLTQNNFWFFADNDALLPTDPWPAGAADISENAEITPVDLPPDSGDRARFRMSIGVATTTMFASSTQFKLQFGAPTSTCGNLGATWVDLGAIGSGSIWRGYNTSVADGAELSGNPPTGGDLLLSDSDRAGSFEEENVSTGTPYTVFVGEEVEYDWIVEDNGAATNTEYCFRMAYTDGSPFKTYNFYPVIRTVGYSPETRNWRWYDDETNETPTSPLANENVAPNSVKFGDIVKLRVTVADTRGHNGVNQKFRLQYSTYSDFSLDVNFVAPTSTCSGAWCYADGVDTDDDAIAALLLTDSAAMGRHNEAPTTTSTLDPTLSTAYETEFTIRHAGAAANTTYFFRLYDVNNDIYVPRDTLATYPSLATGDTTLSFEVLGVVSASSTGEGITTTVATTPTAVPFGTLDIDVSEVGAHTLGVNTNATEGYQVFVAEGQDFISNGGGEIPGVNASNTTPGAWATACVASAVGCFGYHAGDDTLFGGSARFAPDDTWAEFEVPAREIMYSGIPTLATDTADMIFRVERHTLLPAGEYETQIRYIVVPVF